MESFVPTGSRSGAAPPSPAPARPVAGRIHLGVPARPAAPRKLKIPEIRNATLERISRVSIWTWVMATVVFLATLVVLSIFAGSHRAH